MDRSAISLVFLGGFVVAALGSLLLTPVIRDFAGRRSWVDAPDRRRRIHFRQIPRVGGIAIVVAFLLALGFFWLMQEVIIPDFGLPTRYVIGGAIVMAAVGFLDDLYGLHFSRKFGVQLVVASVMIYGGYRIDELIVPFTDDGIALVWWISFPLTLFWIVGVINAVNLLDGMDGLAAGVGVIAFGSLTAVYASQGDLVSLVLVTSVVGALTGFLYYNMSPATVFMGDTGSLFVGFLLATYSLRGTGHANPLLAFMIPIVALGLPMIDTGLALIRRFLERRPLFHPDIDHIHHRIARRLGVSHRGTVMILHAVSIVLGGVALLVAISSDFHATLILVVTAVCGIALLRWLGYLHVSDVRRMLQKPRQEPEPQVPVRQPELVTHGNGSSAIFEHVGKENGAGNSHDDPPHSDAAHGNGANHHR